MQPVIAIMAGGLGKRMNSDIPKVLHKLFDKPMLVHIIEQSRLLNPIKILIIVGKYKNIIIDTLEEYGIINDDLLIFVNQPESLGTGHAMQCCISELQQYKQNIVIILSGDVPLLQYDTLNDFITSFNIAKMITTVLDEPYGYGRIIVNNGFIKIVEEKDCSVEQQNIHNVNCGIYAFNVDILCKYLPYLTNNNSQKEYYLTDIIEIIQNNENIKVDTFMIIKEKQYQIVGVNTPEQLLQLERLII